MRSGAGVSGLYAATLLEKADVDYVILESRVRTGGRVLSAGFSGLHVDMGATWFWPDIQSDFAQLITRLGLPVIPQGRPVICFMSVRPIRLHNVILRMTPHRHHSD
jgi:monoamine oxidase